VSPNPGRVGSNVQDAGSLTGGFVVGELACEAYGEFIAPFGPGGILAASFVCGVGGALFLRDVSNYNKRHGHP
jgi:hypothetical protein